MSVPDFSSPNTLIPGILLLLLSATASGLWNLVRAAEVRRSQGRLTAAVATMQSRLESLHTENKGMLDRLERDQESFRRRMHEVAGSIQSTQTRVAVVEARTDSTDRRLDRMERALELIASKIDRLLETRA